MSFTPKEWQEQAAAKLQQAGQWLKRRTTEDAPFALYGMLCSLSLWPLVEAAQAGQFLPVVMALGSVAGGVGGNLLAEQIQRWVDQADAPTEADLAGWIIQHGSDPALQETLATILEKLEAIPTAHAALSETDKQWFSQTLQRELAQLGLLKRLTATLQGTGIIVQESDLRSGDRGVVASQAGGHIVTGDQNRLVKAGTYIESQTMVQQEATAGPDPEALRMAYLNHLFETCRPLSLAGIDPKAASDETAARLNLGAVYTALLTLTPEAHDRLSRGEAIDRPDKHLPALALLDQHKYLVLLGDPGSGKSTFVNFVTMCLAGAGIPEADYTLETLTAPLPDDDGKDQEERQPWSHGALLPVRVILRDFAAHGLPPAGQKATAQHLWDFIAADLEAATLGDFAELLQTALRGPALGGLLLLDGLDEVPEADRRRVQLKEAVEAFSGAFPGCRILVTSRIYAYQQEDWRLPTFAEAVLAPFSRGQIIRFVDRWYTHMALLRALNLEDAQGRAELLKRAIFGSDRLHELAERPLLLTLMASLHAWRGGSLPERREELYADAVDLLLDIWETRKVEHDAQGRIIATESSLSEWLQVDREAVRDLLSQLAYQAHEAQSEVVGTADVPQGELVSGLMALSQNEEVNPALLVRYLSQRSGLLLPRRAGVYTFPHRTFQEYMAACHLTEASSLEEIAELGRQSPDRWREVVLLAGAKAASGLRSNIWTLVESLCRRDMSPETPALADDLWGAQLAGQALVEVADLKKVHDVHRPKVDRVRRWLVYLLRGHALPAVERTLAGDTLARLGDVRPAVTTLEGMEFCYIPAGPFWMGGEVYEDERPPHQVDIPYDYWLARYPVTVAQFRAFVEAGDNQPYNRASLRGLPNHPLIRVSWHEALEFCRWLTRRWQREGVLPPGWRVMLPSEAEWEKAARGGIKQPAQPHVLPVKAIGADWQPEVKVVANEVPQRHYPWGDQPDPQKANYADTKIGAPSAVGCFAGGASPYGCEDMSGNVWEWTRSLWGEKIGEPEFKYPYNPADGRENLEAGDHVLRALRGGSWFIIQYDARCAARNGDDPGYGLNYLGVRVVVSPI